jgi:hypothetical protein
VSARPSSGELRSRQPARSSAARADRTSRLGCGIASEVRSVRGFWVVTLTGLCAALTCDARANISLTTELRRMRSSDHLFLPQAHRTVQYSGFSRKGDNPDRLDYLYREGPWLVYADAKGPGVVSRIWTTHGGPWHDIRIEVDGRLIYEGNGEGFFGMNRAPFAAPLCEIRKAAMPKRTAEGENGKLQHWGVSYVPMPFAARFRYMQRAQVYANINVKLLEPGTRVEPFTGGLNKAERQEWELTRAAWERMEPDPPTRKLTRVSREITIPTDGAFAGLTLSGPGLIRSVRVRAPFDLLDALSLSFVWDNQLQPAIDVSPDVGMGSVKQRTMALGTDQHGWRFLRLPMPFRYSARLRIAGPAGTPANITVVRTRGPTAIPGHVFACGVELGAVPCGEGRFPASPGAVEGVSLPQRVHSAGHGGSGPYRCLCGSLRLPARA